MRLRRMRHPIDVQLCGPRLRVDQDEKRSMEIRGSISIEIAGVVHSPGESWPDTPVVRSFN
ncbi:hypothetical protein AB0L88_33430 [Saccharopolyspora shandongensis]|uniref:hypothetical protein n=1 Tax=Saccharopolyspora shandongensis TaxID=418495 RepID=UPI00344AC4DC